MNGRPLTVEEADRLALLAGNVAASVRSPDETHSGHVYLLLKAAIDAAIDAAGVEEAELLGLVRVAVRKRRAG